MRIPFPVEDVMRAPRATKVPRQLTIGAILFVALVAFEIFNFDTTKYALANLLGDANFAGFSWAAILATAFCAIDFAGLTRMFTPERGADEPREVWYLMGAWLLGATMNAVMTWWAINLTLLEHDFGNEVLSRAQLLQTVPIFVAVLVWLTRILFIGALSVAGEQLFHGDAQPAQRPVQRPRKRQEAKLKANPGRSVRVRNARASADKMNNTQVYYREAMQPRPAVRRPTVQSGD